MKFSVENTQISQATFSLWKDQIAFQLFKYFLVESKLQNYYLISWPKRIQNSKLNSTVV